MMPFVLGILTGFAFILVGQFFGNETQNLLDNCAKTHNVYQCEMVAVPMDSGEK